MRDRDFLIEIFSEFGPVSLRRMFSGYGIASDGVNFAMAMRAGIIFRVDDQNVARYDAEGAKPFQYTTKIKTVTVQSYRHLPERLYDDPEELAAWAREAVGAAHRAAAKKQKKKSNTNSKTTSDKSVREKAKTASIKKRSATATKRKKKT